MDEQRTIRGDKRVAMSGRSVNPAFRLPGDARVRPSRRPSLSCPVSQAPPPPTIRLTVDPIGRASKSKAGATSGAPRFAPCHERERRQAQPGVPLWRRAAARQLLFASTAGPMTTSAPTRRPFWAAPRQARCRATGAGGLSGSMRFSAGSTWALTVGAPSRVRSCVGRAWCWACGGVVSGPSGRSVAA